MFVPLPSTAVSDLATAHRSPTPKRQQPRIIDPDGFLASSALQPDPLYMGLRSIVTTGPIGRMVERFSAWREAREERHLAAECAVTAADHHARHASTTHQTIDVRERHQHDLAA